MGNIATRVGGVGMVQAFIRRGMKAGKKTREFEEAQRTKRNEEIKTIHHIIPIDPSRGKIINSYNTEKRYDEYEEEMKKREHLDIQA